MNDENFLIPLTLLLKDTQKDISASIEMMLYIIVGVGSQVIFFYFFIINDPLNKDPTSLYDNFWPHITYGLLGLLCFIPIFFTPYLIGGPTAWILTKPFKVYINFLHKNIKEIEKSISKDINSTQTLDEVLMKLESCRELLEKINRIKVIRFYNKKLYYRWKKILRVSILWILQVIKNLRSDLVTRLTEQRSILESAKTEVEKNLTGTPELIAVSEAQQVRLDRQIEQFEELQRVLVRV